MANDVQYQSMLRLIRRVFRRFESKRTPNESTWKFTINVEADTLDGGFVATVAELPGAAGQGETVHEAIDDVIAAITEIFEARMLSRLASDPRIDSPGRHEVLVPAAAL